MKNKQSILLIIVGLISFGNEIQGTRSLPGEDLFDKTKEERIKALEQRLFARTSPDGNTNLHDRASNCDLVFAGNLHLVGDPTVKNYDGETAADIVEKRLEEFEDRSSKEYAICKKMQYLLLLMDNAHIKGWQQEAFFDSEGNVNVRSRVRQHICPHGT